MSELLDVTRATLEWDEFSRTGVLWSGLDSISFTPGDPVLVEDFSRLVRVEPIVYARGRLLLPDSTFEFLADRLGRRLEPLRPIKAIVIDAGHGGRDPGANRTITVDGVPVTWREKDLVLDMALRVRRLLEPLVDGPKVVLTRDYDVFLELRERTALANSLRTDPLDNVLFVSIHVNASAAQWTDARGVEIYYLPATQRRQVLDSTVAAAVDPEVASILNDLKEEEYTVESVLLGKQILDSIAERMPQTPIERGIKEANLFVAREARMPSILIETGFINNRADLDLLVTPEYRRRVSEAIAHGIAAYVRDFEQLR